MAAMNANMTDTGVPKCGPLPRPKPDSLNDKVMGTYNRMMKTHKDEDPRKQLTGRMEMWRTGEPDPGPVCVTSS